jgi:hypothetical protein
MATPMHGYNTVDVETPLEVEQPQPQTHRVTGRRLAVALAATFVLSGAVNYAMIPTLVEPTATASLEFDAADADPGSVYISSSCAKSIKIGLGVGAGVGAVTLPIILVALGLSPIGPIAGGWFAANQGAALAAGGAMATMQSMAMFGSLAKSIMIGVGFTATGAGAGLATALQSKFCKGD